MLKQYRISLSLPGYQNELFARIKAAAGLKPFAVVLIHGGSLTLPWVDQVDSLLTAFYPGEQGGAAVADVLFGDYNPGGRLSTTWVKSESDLPPFIDMSLNGRTYRYFDGSPLFPFGYGLSYTTFSYNQATISKSSIAPCENITVKVNLQNTGTVLGDEVAQVYISLLNRTISTANIKLVAFDRFKLPSGATIPLTFTITYEQMAVVAQKSLVIEPGTIQVYVGGGQPKYSNTQKLSFDIVGPLTPVSTCKI